MELSNIKCPECYGTGIDRLRSGFVKKPCLNCKGRGIVGMSEMKLHGEDGD